MDTIRAVYHNGQLELLDPVDLQEGQQIYMRILSEADIVREVLGDLIAPRVPLSDADEAIDIEALRKQVIEDTKGVTLSDIIIEERRTGP